MTANWNILAPFFSVPVKKDGRRKTFVDRIAAAERGKNAAAMKKVYALLKLNPEINIDKDSAGGWWVCCDRFDPDGEDDPLRGEHFCADGQETLEAVNVYINHPGA